MSKGSARRPGEIAQDRWDAIFNKKANVRHDLDAELVKAQVAKKLVTIEQTRILYKKQEEELLAKYESDKLNNRAHLWTNVPKGPKRIDPMINGWAARERNCYAKVRIIEFPEGERRFLLVYGDEDDTTVTSGTGPFETQERAAAWFLNGGR